MSDQSPYTRPKVVCLTAAELFEFVTGSAHIQGPTMSGGAFRPARVVLQGEETLQWLEAHEVENTSAREGGEQRA